MIFTNLDYGGKKGEHSAYSVFNKNFQRLPGTFSAESMIMAPRYLDTNEKKEKSTQS